jgi:hypothetical protein
MIRGAAIPGPVRPGRLARLLLCATLVLRCGSASAQTLAGRVALLSHTLTCNHMRACLKCIVMNMVRAGVVRHPREWIWTVWHELAGQRERHRLIDQEALLNRLEGVSRTAFRKHYKEMMEDMVRAPGRLERDNRWTESVGVGRAAFAAGPEAALKESDRRRKMDRAETADGRWILRKRSPTLGLYARTMPQNDPEGSKGP